MSVKTFIPNRNTLFLLIFASKQMLQRTINKALVNMENAKKKYCQTIHIGWYAYTDQNVIQRRFSPPANFKSTCTEPKRDLAPKKTMKMGSYLHLHERELPLN